MHWILALLVLIPMGVFSAIGETYGLLMKDRVHIAKTFIHMIKEEWFFEYGEMTPSDFLARHGELCVLFEPRTGLCDFTLNQVAAAADLQHRRDVRAAGDEGACDCVTGFCGPTCDWNCKMSMREADRIVERVGAQF